MLDNLRCVIVLPLEKEDIRNIVIFSLKCIQKPNVSYEVVTVEEKNGECILNSAFYIVCTGR